MPRIRASIVAVVALLFAAVGNTAPGAGGVQLERAGTPRVLVLPPRVPEVLESLDDGVRAWLHAHLAKAQLELLDRATVDGTVARLVTDEAPILFGTDGPALREASGADLVVSTQIRYEAGEVLVWIRLFDAETGAPQDIGKAEGKLGELGKLLVEAASPTFTGVGLSVRARPPEELRLGDLSQLEKAWQKIAAGELAEGWRQLEGNASETAEWLRGRAVARAEEPETPITERSRLASARGTNDTDWLKIRHGLTKGDDADVLVAGADNAVARNANERALELYARAAELEPGNEAAARGAARMHTALDQRDEARQAYEKVLELEPGDTEAHANLGANPTVSKQARATHLLAAGEAEAGEFRTESANQHLGQAGKLGMLQQARQNVALMNERMGNHGDALVTYEELAANGQTDVYTQLGLARTRKQAGDSAGAAKAVDSALAADPKNVEALQHRGRALLEAGDADEAVVALEKAVSLEPTNVSVRRDLARAHQEAGNPEAALEALDPESVDPADRAGLLADAASIHEATGDSEQATFVLEKAIALEPEDAVLRTSLARAYRADGKSEAADAEEALLVSLTGARVATADADESARADAATIAQGAEFEALVAGFPLVTTTNEKIETVVFLGIDTPDDWRFRLRQWLMPRLIDVGAMERSIAATLGNRYRVMPPSQVGDVAANAHARVLAFGKDSNDIALINDLMGADALVRARLTVGKDTAELLWAPPAQAVSIEARMMGGRTSDDVFIQTFAGRMKNTKRFVAWNPRAALPGSLLLILLLYPLVRGWGTLVVKLEYQVSKSSKGFFSIQLSRKPGQAKQEKKAVGQEQERLLPAEGARLVPLCAAHGRQRDPVPIHPGPAVLRPHPRVAPGHRLRRRDRELPGGEEDPARTRQDRRGGVRLPAQAGADHPSAQPRRGAGGGAGPGGGARPGPTPFAT